MTPHAVAQVKFGNRAIGRPAVQGLHGAATGASREGLFFSAGGYTRQAEEWADRVGVALFVLGDDGEVAAANRHAERMVRSVKGLPPPRDPTPWIIGLAVAVWLGSALWGASVAGWIGFVLVGGVSALALSFFAWIAKEMFGTAIMIRELSRRPPAK